MGNEKYLMAFATGGLFHSESMKLAALYLETGDWKVVREDVIEQNLLQARTLSTLKRNCREVITRLRELSKEELIFLVESNHKEQAYMLWIAVCRRYRFIAEFAQEVLRERYITLKADLNHEEYDAFFNRKSDWHPELESIKPITRNKLRQVLFRILREADLITDNHFINAAMLTPSFVHALQSGRRQDLLCFPIFESDLKRIA